MIDIRRLEEGSAPAAVVGEYGHRGSVSVPVSGGATVSGSGSAPGFVSVSRLFRGSLEAQK